MQHKGIYSKSVFLCTKVTLILSLLVNRWKCIYCYKINRCPNL